MHGDTLLATARPPDWSYVNTERCRRCQSPKRGGAPVTEQRPVTAGEHRCDPPAMPGQLLMPDGVDPTMDPVQPAGREAVTDPAGQNPGQ